MSAPADLAAAFTKLNTAVTATTAEITAWKALAKNASSNTVETKVGLFGHDLETFLADCVALEAACDTTDYDAYTGWGVGVQWSSTAANSNAKDGVAFTASKQTVQVTWGASAGNANDVESAVATAEPSATKPINTEVTLTDATDGFAAWGAKNQASATAQSQFAFSFFEDGDDTFYFEAGDTVSIWTTKGAIAGADNIANAEFELVGAASLTAATSVIVASLLF